MSVRIVCICKNNGNHYSHEAIDTYGWVNENSNDKSTKKTDRQAMVNWVRQGNQAYVKDSHGNIAYCDARTSLTGTEFLQTYADNKYTDNLLSLPECR